MAEADGAGPRPRRRRAPPAAAGLDREPAPRAYRAPSGARSSEPTGASISMPATRSARTASPAAARHVALGRSRLVQPRGANASGGVRRPTRKLYLGSALGGLWRGEFDPVNPNPDNMNWRPLSDAVNGAAHQVLVLDGPPLTLLRRTPTPSPARSIGRRTAVRRGRSPPASPGGCDDCCGCVMPATLCSP